MVPVLAMLVLGACGQPDATEPAVASSPAPIDPRHPCALLTSGDIAAATGGEVSEGKEKETMQSILQPEKDFNPICVYRTGPPYVSVAIYIEKPETAEHFRRLMGDDPINTVEIEDLGDAAFIHAGVGLSILVDDTAVTATVRHFDTVEQTQDVLTELGETIVRRLSA